MADITTKYKSKWTGAEIDDGIEKARNAVPLDGSKAMTGTLNVNIRENIGSFGVDNTNDYAYIQHSKSDGTAAKLTINPTRARYARKADANGAWTSYDLLHTGNKPSGSYTGNGDATARMISTGGIGRIIAIRSGKGAVIVFGGDGSLSVPDSGGISRLASAQAGFDDSGVLTIASDSVMLNENGRKYSYQVL